MPDLFENPPSLPSIEERMRKLDALYHRTSRGPWKADKIENFGDNWPIGIMSAGESRACDGQHIVTTDGVPASMATCDAEADCQWIAAVHNAWPGIQAVLAAQAAPAPSWELVEQCEEALNACMSEMKKEFEHAGQEYEDEQNQCDSDECLRCFIWNTCEPVIAEISRAKEGK